MWSVNDGLSGNLLETSGNLLETSGKRPVPSRLPNFFATTLHAD
jgi:hypothetical protein